MSFHLPERGFPDGFNIPQGEGTRIRREISHKNVKQLLSVSRGRP
jgi:hypothetical protein